MGAVLLLALTVGQAVPPEAAGAPPASGTWYIDGDEVLANGTFHLKDEVLVNGTGSLTITNATLVFDGLSIFIYSFGRLEISNSTLVLGGSAYTKVRINVDGIGANMSNSTFDNISVGASHGQCRISGCTFTGPEAFIISYTNNPAYIPVISNCTFVDTGDICLSGDQGGFSVTGCRFFQDASDEVEMEMTEAPEEGPEPGVAIERNLFIGLQTGVFFNWGSWYDGPLAVHVRQPGQGTFLIRDSIFAGFTWGINVLGYSGPVSVSGNSYQDCAVAVNAAGITFDQLDVDISENRIEGGREGISVCYGRLTVAKNTISNCTSAGIYGSFDSTGYGGPTIRDNTVTGCYYGAMLNNVVFDFSHNNISDCRRAGMYSYLSCYEAAVRNNTFARCGPGGSPNYWQDAAISATAVDSGRIRVSGNSIRHGSEVGIRAAGDVSIDNNTIEGATTGMECSNLGSAPQEISRNRILGGETGILLEGVSRVVENDISLVRTGMLCMIEGASGNLQVVSNAVHAGGQGIVVRNDKGAAAIPNITGNVVSAGIDGVLVDSAQADIRLNDFGGTTGVCVHAVGQEPDLRNNSYGRMCALRVRQEWYLAVNALESTDPYGSGPLTNTDRFTVRVRSGSGAPGYDADSGRSTVVHANLTGHTIDRDGQRANFTRYDLTVMKPGAGVGNATVTMTGANAHAAIQLLPRADLAVQAIGLPGGRPLAGRTCAVEVSVVHDTTYDRFFTYLGAVKVALQDNGLPIGDTRIARLEPNATAVVQFGWAVQGGVHELSAIVDPEMRIAEAFEDNNLLSRRVAANDVPVAVLSVSDPGPPSGRTVAFSSASSIDDTGVARSLFEFGDGTDSGWTDDSTVLHVFGMPGVYEARLRVADAEGAESGWSPPVSIAVTEGPLEVALAASSTQFETLVPVRLSASPSDTGGALYVYAWDFGDGTSELGRTAEREHTFRRAGDYTAGVTVIDQTGRRGAATLRLSVQNRPPEAAMDYSPDDPTVLAPVQFRSVSGDRDGVIVAWRWDLGDGNRSADPAPRHQYLEKGEYAVALEVQDDSGARSTAAVGRLLVNNTAPAARARAAAAPVRAGSAVRLDAGLSVDPDDHFRTLSFFWSSPDGWSAAGPNATRRFDAPGRYRITLAVTDGSGASSQDTLTIEVVPAEEAGGPRYRETALALSASAVSVFVAALALFGRDRTGERRARRS
jgi:PKD repeat protein